MLETKSKQSFPIWVLNLERASDRRQSMEKQLTELQWQFEFIQALDGNCLNAEARKSYSAWQAIKIVKRELSPGEIGCALSHAKLWARIVAENIEEVLILEDDVLLTPDLMRVLERRHLFPADWELINLKTDAAKIPFGPSVYSNYRVCHFQEDANRTCGYLINHKGAKKLCTHVYPIRLAADGLTGRTSITKLVSYGIDPDLVRLADFPSMIKRPRRRQGVRHWWRKLYTKWNKLMAAIT